MKNTHSPAELEANRDHSSTGLTLGELVFENAPFGVVVLDTSLQVLSVNRTLRGWFGHDPSGPVQKLDVIDLIRVRYPSERSRVVELLNAVKSGTSPAPLTMTVSAGEGSQIDVSVTASALREPNGAVHAYAVYLHVLDSGLLASQDRHHAEELRRATHRFDHMAEAHHDSCIYFLSPDGKIYEWSSSAKRLHGFSSEQMRHLTIFADLLMDSVPKDLHPDQIRYRDGMRNALKRLGIMFEALLTYARLGRIDLHPSPMASAPVVQDVIARVQEKYPGVKATFHVQDDLPVVISDHAMLTEVLTQVVDNAVKFSQRAAKPEIHIGWSPEAGSTGLFFVADNGVGFNVEKAANLFVMFSRQHHSLEFTGDGIGLALAKRIIERHNGRMWADSVPGHGCTLYFSLPVEHRITPSQLSALGI